MSAAIGGGLPALSVTVRPREEEQLAEQLWELGCIGVVEEGDRWVAYFEPHVNLQALQSDLPFASAILEDQTVSTVPVRGEPVLLGSRFYVSEGEELTGRTRLPIRSSNAFGTGRHETTQLCVQALESLPVQGCFVLDVGCGTGILGLVALQLGARQVISCDIDGDAVRIAREHLRMVFQGSLDAVADGSADLVIANLTPAILDQLAGELRRVVKPTGNALISGFLSEQAPTHFEAKEERESNGWLCWTCSPSAIRSPGKPPEGGWEHKREWWL